LKKLGIPSLRER